MITKEMVHKAVCDILSNETITAGVGYLKTNSLELPGGVVVLFVDKATTGKQRLLLADDGAAIYEAVRKAYEWEEANGGIPE